ncbi:succinylglutamate-semialdehyde dehydrogenase [Acinetobacter pullicarnis]|uniref:succinylglutamate-semialdehyde dehydrogenase n=1 Tax=Acinetobacter pullicarnis TaxID=2576829 RepID=UPI001120D1A8|nr:succinylglutamate-semialdehyde dehydrogenase [Acinetobacter pullicarnis]
MSQGYLYIDGTWVQGRGDQWIKSNPVNQQPIWRGHAADSHDVEQAGLAARQAFVLWARRPLAERIAVVEAFASLLEQHKTHLAQVISQETSKPLWETLTEVQAMIGKVAISIGAYQQRTGETTTAFADGVATLRHRPHGVLAVFGPYNFPGHLPNGHIVPALIAGNSVLFKPSELTPWTAEETVKLWHQAGLPAGVLNLLQGGRQTGEALIQTAQIDGVLFTGSAETGGVLHRQLAGHPEKILALEMGGNNALIIDEITDLDAVVNLTLQSAFISAGQRCTCARRLIIKRGAAGDAFVQRLLQATQQLLIGEWDAEPQPFIGGVISVHAANQMLAAQQRLIELGANVLLELKALRDNSSLLRPGILELTDVTDVPDEEYFGPLTMIYRYDDFDEALRLANATRFGLALGLVSTDRALFERLLLEARAGIVNWNKPLTGASSAAPFGGVGASGNHRASAFYAADYCAWPMASLEREQLNLAEKRSPGIVL